MSSASAASSRSLYLRETIALPEHRLHLSEDICKLAVESNWFKNSHKPIAFVPSLSFFRINTFLLIFSLLLIVSLFSLFLNSLAFCFLNYSFIIYSRFVFKCLSECCVFPRFFLMSYNNSYLRLPPSGEPFPSDSIPGAGSGGGGGGIGA